MKRKTTAALLLQRSGWFDTINNHEAIKELQEDGDRIIFKLSPILDIKKTWSIYSTETAAAVSVELRSLDCELIILVYQTRVDHFFLSQILKGVGRRPLIAWCYLPWSRIPRPMTYEDLVKGSSMYAMSVSLAELSNSKIPCLALFGSADDPAVQQNIRHFSHAAQASRDLAKVKVGYLGLNGDAGSSANFTPLNRLGINSLRIELSDFQNHMSSIASKDVEKYLTDLDSLQIDVMVTDETIRKTAGSALALLRLGKEKSLDYFAVPDHAAQFRSLASYCPGIPPHFDPDGIPTFIPSVDIDAIASSIVLNLISNNICFLMRLWFWDQARNLVVGGHGGMQNPAEIAAGPMIIAGDYECVRNDPDGGAQIEFIAKPGRVTLLQLCNTPTGMKAMSVTGMCLESDPWIEGIPHAIVRLDCSISKFLRRLSQEGGTAYWVMTYGSHVEELAALFELMAIPYEVLHD